MKLWVFLKDQDRVRDIDQQMKARWVGKPSKCNRSVGRNTGGHDFHGTVTNGFVGQATMLVFLTSTMN